ncbi:hypothetical protein [Metapseudomonas otitidis]|uniref:hypothetical protein n=1 Tax=Metapseudomonas otitidis TaxID=319939 RepID=UPI00244A0D6C|nr:hypothetical protein [Pseudomonas otitidis]MDG9784624.1 hypothetical protein [Pseudomonas otitidis]
MLWYGKVGTTQYFNMPDDQPWQPIEGWIEIPAPAPSNRPDRFGDWYVQPDGSWLWVKYPDPPFPVAYFEGKLVNQDTMLEITPETLPGNIASRLSTIEGKVLQVETVTCVLAEGGSCVAEFSKQYLEPPKVIPVPVWVGDQQFVAVPEATTLTGVTLSGKRSRAVIAIGSGLFEPAAEADPVSVLVIGKEAVTNATD